MIVDFDEESHTYSVDGEIAKLSVTELLAKHKLSPSYSGANEELLRESAQYGKEIHKELEDIANAIINEGHISVPHRTINGENFINWLIEKRTQGLGVLKLQAEQKLGLNYKGLLVGGTADLIVTFFDNLHNRIIRYVIDHKTTSVVHTKAVKWQCSLLDYMLVKHYGEKEHSEKNYCLHYGKDGSFEEVELEKVADEEIERLLECELNDELYTEPTLNLTTLDSNMELQERLEKAEQFLAIKEQELKQAKADAEKIRAILLEQFEQQKGIDKWVSPSGKVVVQYYKPTTTTIVDKDKLETEYPDVYKDCLKQSTKKGYVKVQVKKED